MNAESESWHDELELISDLATVQKQISAYVLRALNADALREEPTVPSQEDALGTRLIDLGNALQARATRRSTDTRRITKEHPARDATRNRPREPRTPWTNPSATIYMS